MRTRLRHAAAHLTLVTLGGDDSFAMLDDTGRFNGALLQALAALAAPQVHSAPP